jgi:hypothetical protein
MSQEMSFEKYLSEIKQIALQKDLGRGNSTFLEMGSLEKLRNNTTNKT